MRSFPKVVDDRRRIYLSLVGGIESRLRDLYAKRFDSGQETQATLARKLGVHRSVVHRRLNGGENMTLKSIADLVWALGGAAEVDIFDPADRPEKNHVVTVNSLPVRTPTTLTRVGMWDSSSKPHIQLSGAANLIGVEQ